MYAEELIKSFGLTDRDIHLFLAAFNALGVPYEDDQETGVITKVCLDWITPEYLSQEMAGAADVAFEDRKAFGRCLDGIEDDGPDAPGEYLACAKRLATLTPEQAVALRFFALGFWDGASAAQKRAAA